MSYSLNTPCWDCVKSDSCTDRHVLGGAIQGIHQMPGRNTGKDFGHMGSGSINLTCMWYEKKPEETK
jgi:hypothetical protein